MKLAVITINYNGSENTLKLLKSLKEQTVSDFEIIVVDNASEEADFNNLKNIPRINLIRNKANLGFSGGNNIGIKMALNQPAGGEVDWVILLNNDAQVGKDFIALLRAKLGQLDPLMGSGRGGIVGLPLVEDEYTAYCGRIQWLRPTLKHVHNPPYAEYLRRNRKYYAIGGGMAIHCDAFKEIGLLDEKYFLYFEDADFSMKAVRADIPVFFIEEPKARHQVSATTKKLGSPVLFRYHYRNSLYFNWKNGPWYIKILVWPWSFWIMKKQLLKIIFMYKSKESRAIIMGIFDFYRGRTGKITK